MGTKCSLAWTRVISIRSCWPSKGSRSTRASQLRSYSETFPEAFAPTLTTRLGCHVGNAIEMGGAAEPPPTADRVLKPAASGTNTRRSSARFGLGLPAIPARLNAPTEGHRPFHPTDDTGATPVTTTALPGTRASTCPGLRPHEAQNPEVTPASEAPQTPQSPEQATASARLTQHSHQALLHPVPRAPRPLPRRVRHHSWSQMLQHLRSR